MYGLKLYICRHDETDEKGRPKCLPVFEPKDGSYFCKLFEPLFNEFSRCHWALSSGSMLFTMHCPEDNVYQEYTRFIAEFQAIKDRPELYYPPGIIFPNRAKYLSDDHTMMVGVFELPQESELQDMLNMTDEFIREKSDFYIQIYERAWEFFARSKSYFDIIQKHVLEFLPNEYWCYLDVNNKNEYGLYERLRI